MIANIEYKGFTIFSTEGRFFVKAASFKQEGYPTANHAKGAITNYLKAQELKAAIAAEVFPAEAQAELENEGLSHLTQVLAHHGLISKPAATPAPKSRNKREGHYFGKIAGEEFRGRTRKASPMSVGSMQNTRKQRKARKLDSRAHVQFLNNALFAALAA